MRLLRRILVDYGYGRHIMNKFKIGVCSDPNEDTRWLFNDHFKILNVIGYDCGRMNTRKDYQP